jgi:type IV pilus assembly protein PilA
MFSKLNKKSRGFTLIELLVVVLILAILMAVALPLYLNSIANAELRTCRSNMQTIANAVHAQYVANRGVGGYTLGTVDAAYLAANHAKDLLTVPVCPNNGTYSLVAGTAPAPFAVHCTVAVHDAPGDFQFGTSNN